MQGVFNDIPHLSPALLGVMAIKCSAPSHDIHCSIVPVAMLIFKIFCAN
jgi:hypothetical protein